MSFKRERETGGGTRVEGFTSVWMRTQVPIELHGRSWAFRREILYVVIIT